MTAPSLLPAELKYRVAEQRLLAAASGTGSRRRQLDAYTPIAGLELPPPEPDVSAAARLHSHHDRQCFLRTLTTILHRALDTARYRLQVTRTIIRMRNYHGVMVPQCPPSNIESARCRVFTEIVSARSVG